MPDDTATAWAVPHRSASSASKANTSGPVGATQPESRAASSSFRSGSRTSGGESQILFVALVTEGQSSHASGGVPGDVPRRRAVGAMPDWQMALVPASGPEHASDE